jgi:hypothetical protein
MDIKSKKVSMVNLQNNADLVNFALLLQFISWFSLNALG